MTTPTARPHSCPACGAAVGPQSRFCPACGRPLNQQPQPPDDEIVVTSTGRLRLNNERVSLHALHEFVQQCVTWWQQRLNGGEVSREEASRNIGELRQALLSVAQQLEQGRTTLRVTGSLPAAKRFPVGCPRCGRGNRAGARFCYACGWSFESQAAQPPATLRFHAANITDRGPRETNQDRAIIVRLALPDGQSALCCLVADGMGGAQGGAEASRLATTTIVAELKKRTAAPPADEESWRVLLRDVIQQANSTIYEQAQRTPEQRGMGTTVVLAVLLGRQAHIASVGDSRIYIVNQRGVTADGVTWAQLTVDHTLVARLLDLGAITKEQALTHPRGNVLYRSVGVEPTVDVDTDTQPLQPGDRLLLCSDGMTNALPDATLASTIMAAPTAADAVNSLMEKARKSGLRDNATALVASIDVT